MKHMRWDQARKSPVTGQAWSGMRARCCCARPLTRRDSPRGWARRCRRRGSRRCWTAGSCWCRWGRRSRWGREHERYRRLARLAPVLGTVPCAGGRGGTGLVGGTAMLERIGRDRAKARAHVWELIAARRPVPVAGHRREDPDGVAVIDVDATLVTATRIRKARSTWKKGYGFHPLAAWCSNTRECLAMLLRPGNAARTRSPTTERCWPPRSGATRPVRRKILVRVDRAGASHELIKHLLAMSSARRKVLFTCGWMITATDEPAIAKLPADAWKPGIAQDGSPEEDKDAAEITRLMRPAGNSPADLRGSCAG